MHKRITLAVIAMLAVLALTTVGSAAADSNKIFVPLESVGGSGVTGEVELVQNSKDVMINVAAFDLMPMGRYISLYYSNNTCQVEQYSHSDVIGGHSYMANSGGLGVTSGMSMDSLDQINSVSVRRASDFTLLACAQVHP